MPETVYNPQLLIERVDLKEKSEEHSLIGSLPDLTSILDSQLDVEYHNGRLYFAIKRNPLSSILNELPKRIFDVFFSGLVVLFVLSWLTPILAILIKLDSRGPVFYKQKRSGKNNKVFFCLKFRTMTYIKNAEFRPATKDDCRVTRVGKFLRKTSLDEFPQFFNVFIGDMSTVGPRPHPLKLNDDFQHRVDKYMLRHVVKPGVTGLAQAKGYRGEVSDTLTMKQRIKVDIFYIENWSFMLDLKIVLMTALNILQGDKNAY